MAISQLTNRRNDVSPVVQSARERVSPVREPWCPGLLPQEQGPIANNRPTTGTTLHDDRDEQPSRQGRDFLHVPHLSQYRLNGQTARTQAPELHCMPAQFHFGSL